MRLKALDALRGIAALMVVLYHCWQTLDGALADGIRAALLYTPLKPIVGARPAVVLFFVLSGFVLALALQREPGWRGFALRRVARIWLPFAFSVLLSAGLLLLLNPQPVADASGWFNGDPWAMPLTPAVLARHLLMLGDVEGTRLNVVMWSLVYELRLSLVFPLLLGLAALPLRWLVPGMLAFQLAVDAAMRAAGLPLAPFHGEGGLAALLTTLHFANCFLLGCVLALRLAAIRAALLRLPRWAFVALWLPAVALQMPSIDATCTLGAGLMMALALTRPGLLEAPPLLWLGRVSYSLYLVHVPVLLAVVHGLAGVVPVPWAVALVPGLSLLAGWGCYLAVEAPTAAWARRLGASSTTTPKVAVA